MHVVKILSGWIGFINSKWVIVDSINDAWKFPNAEQACYVLNSIKITRPEDY